MMEKPAVVLGAAPVAGCGGSPAVQRDSCANVPECASPRVGNYIDNDWACVAGAGNLHCDGEIQSGVCFGNYAIRGNGGRGNIDRRTGDYDICANVEITCRGRVIVQGSAKGNPLSHPGRENWPSGCQLQKQPVSGIATILWVEHVREGLLKRIC